MGNNDRFCKAVIDGINCLLLLVGTWVCFLAVYVLRNLSWLTPFRYGETLGYNIPLGIITFVGVLTAIASLAYFLIEKLPWACNYKDAINAIYATLYFCILSVTVVLLVGASIATLTIWKETERSLETDMEKSLSIYRNKDNEFHNQTVSHWNRLQKEMLCCGVQNYSDWLVFEIPTSCCIQESVNCTLGINNTTSVDDANKMIYTRGCFSTVLDHWYIQHFGWICLGFGIFLMTSTCCVCLAACTWFISDFRVWR